VRVVLVAEPIACIPDRASQLHDECASVRWNQTVDIGYLRTVFFGGPICEFVLVLEA
jgi:hypothetical protein